MQMSGCELTHVKGTRFSTRTRQRHPVGGFTGRARYEGALAQFLPYLRAATFTGVGRHASWGNGELRIIAAC
ncbi:MAG: CRISPR system precrRNA processing endoribonuclease RAMP protein Cas6 [Acidobacteriaceae bacterium]|nr:CRISPR system precrRNA processing endoribonuclease RAMP protein Cas6 [Acidobacteriaceae bacterium]